MTKQIGEYSDGKMRILIHEIADDSKLFFDKAEIRGWQEIVIVIRRGNLVTVGIRMLPSDNVMQAAIEEEMRQEAGDDS